MLNRNNPILSAIYFIFIEVIYFQDFIEVLNQLINNDLITIIVDEIVWPPNTLC